ncbi:FHA domain-containing protein [Tepidiforma sp.]|uniref:FHA domain-containing protein n=1 Tax=Tepidiforma sp. TaxID=2682230 RepID=UPI002ADDE020|nr:FHA domain-containing protein [Tepidiforma sp.]
MNDSVELLLLRLAMFLVIFGTCAAVVRSLRADYRPAPRRTARAAPAAQWRLVLEAPGESGVPRGTAYRLAAAMEIGRDGASGIVIGDSSVSARHARIERLPDGWLVRDLGSTNGTFVEGRAVPERGLRLAGGERIQLGAVVFRLVPPDGR